MHRFYAALGRFARLVDRLSGLAIVAGAMVFAGHLLWRSVSESLWFLLLALPAAATTVFLIHSLRGNPKLGLMAQSSSSGRALKTLVQRPRAGTARSHPGPD